MSVEPPNSSSTEVTIELERLSPGIMLRGGGLDDIYAAQLAESGAEFAPILVQRRTMRIIDGAHRWRAAQFRGRQDIQARLVDDDDDDAFLRAVRANVTHGLPLSLTDRRAAAARLITIRPEWSNRAIGREVGLSDKTVAAVRRISSRDDETARKGLDGRVRPINSAAGRRLASELLARRPNDSLRKIAKSAGISASTVRDVKEKLRRGVDPIARRPQAAPPRLADRAARTTETDTGTMLGSLMRDPSLRYTEAGRALLQWMRLQVELTNSDALVRALPTHCLQRVAELSRRSATRWESLAKLAETRERSGDTTNGRPAAM